MERKAAAEETKTAAEENDYEQGKQKSKQHLTARTPRKNNIIRTEEEIF